MDGLLAKYLWRMEPGKVADPNPAAFLDTVPAGKTFGVFATVKRGDKIHGCIGSWARPKGKGKDLTSTKPISGERILVRARSALYSAIFEDPRRFRTPVWQDPTAHIEITFMLGPIEEHTPTTMTFSHASQGIIVEDLGDGDGDDPATATFLPGVFDETTPIAEIKRKLLEKAGIADDSETAKFYTYTSHRISSTMQELVMYSLAFTSGPMFVANYLNVIASASTASTPTSPPHLPPYAIDEEGKVTYDELQCVRNAGVVGDVLDYGADRNLLAWARSYIAHHFKDLSVDGATEAQAVSFVAHHMPLITPACHLMQRVLLSLDSTFALPEVLLGLYRTRCHTKTSTLPRAMNQLRGAIETLDVARNPSACFALNWASQVAALYTDRALLGVVSSQWMAWIGAVFDRTRVRLFESNELAVVFEGLTHMIMGGRSRPEFVRVWLTCLYVLLSRTQPSSGLIAFTNHTARLDITSHVVRAIQHISRIPTASAGSRTPTASGQMGATEGTGSSGHQSPHQQHLAEVARGLLRSHPSVPK